MIKAVTMPLIHDQRLIALKKESTVYSTSPIPRILNLPRSISTPGTLPTCNRNLWLEQFRTRKTE